MDKLIRINRLNEPGTGGILKEEFIFENDVEIPEMCDFIGKAIQRSVYVVSARTENYKNSISVNGYEDISEFSNEACRSSWASYCQDFHPWEVFNMINKNDFTPEDIND